MASRKRYFERTSQISRDLAPVSMEWNYVITVETPIPAMDTQCNREEFMNDCTNSGEATFRTNIRGHSDLLEHCWNHRVITFPAS